ncbi:alpha/beta hydrolase-fold protein [uncultured Tenacibaculum sp.]|uniref:alpha/beta hydrolase-fold protein n=1 Tax=uncultured Tenacibaculum sp. TaxID=174713 RepID=UPI00260A134B|nr:alpha/beta hydrolase-fold protein [uncultured Tenacibaculum sp.]
MKKIISLSIVLFTVVFNNIHAQEINSNFIGEKHIVNSDILKEKREISIYLPENYQHTKTDYPVLYILDGQRYFLNGILYQNTLKWQEKTPDFIVIGINTNNRKRRKLFFDDSKMFIDFLDNELIPYVDRNYRTSSKRLFFGWEMAGGLAIELLAQSQSMFSAYFIASPTHINATRLDTLKKKLMSKDNVNEFIYFSISPEESWSIPSLESLSEILKEHASSGLKWYYKILNEENHHSTPTKTIHEGLNKYFWDYPYLRFYSLKEFIDFGGISALKEYYIKRGKKYNLSKEIHMDTKHFLLLQSMKENNFVSFDFFMNEFKGFYKSKTRDIWFNRYAQFYLKHQKPNEAIEILTVGFEKFQNSSIILGGLGDAYVNIGDKVKAKKHYIKAIDLASRNGDKNIKAYKSKLEQI